MRNGGWWVGGLILTLLVASLPARAAAPDDEKKPPDAAVEAARQRIREELRKDKPDYEKIEKPLEELLEKARRDDEAKGLPEKDVPEPVLRERMDAALEAKQYDLAAYYLDRIKLAHDKPNPFGGWLDLTIWTIVVFLLLLFVLGRFAWKPMLQGLETRERNIAKAIADAQQAREEAQRLREEIQTERQKIADMRREEMDKARAEGQRVADEMQAKAKADIQAERERLRREMQTARDQGVLYLRNSQVELVTLAASKVIGRELTGDDHRRLVDEALVEVRQAGEAWRDSTVGVA